MGEWLARPGPVELMAGASVMDAPEPPVAAAGPAERVPIQDDALKARLQALVSGALGG